MPSDGHADGGGARAWLRRWWRALVSELLATALLVLLGLASLLASEAPLTAPAFAFGFAVLVNVEAFGPASGAHMNPAVTLAALLSGRLAAPAAAAYALAQLAGALLGCGALKLLSPRFTGVAGVTLPGSVGAPAAALVEAALTGALALLCCALWAAHDAARPDPAASVKFGLAVAGLVYAGGPMTGASLNPARSFAPALLQNAFKDHWVYWVGPLGGAAAAALLHRFVLLPPRAPAPRREELPLHDKPDH
ncbi:lens fiber major intrinsic protein-like [Bicyclus anynana]|uniref:Lens fiber major intrinsic protein-like n=1 Tax=Bicyclus anynana TaxID=110368 RepID=A0A6J1NPJ9_BICAN|nr:lens fiber major intrinsic protein-like [Bicyclus anynana]